MTKRLEEKTKKYLKENYVDVCVGPMTLEEIEYEIRHYITQYKGLKQLVIDINQKENIYQTAIYMRKSDFKRKWDK